MFSAGEAYERFMGRWSRTLAVPFVQFAGVQHGDSVLDVGSGTGAVTAAVAAVSPSSRIVGIDSAEGFVTFAQEHHQGDLIRFEVGDAQQLRFADQSFTRALSLLNLNFIPDSGKALREMARVTQPGGIVAGRRVGLRKRDGGAAGVLGRSRGVERQRRCERRTAHATLGGG